MSLVPLAPFRSAAEAFVRKCFKSHAHVIDFSFNRVSHRFRQRVKCVGKCRRPNLEGCRHKLLFCLPRPIFTGSDFAPGLVELGFGLVAQLEVTLQIIVDPFADRFDLFPWQLWNRCSDFFNRAHAKSLRWKAFACNLKKLGERSQRSAKRGIRNAERRVELRRFSGNRQRLIRHLPRYFSMSRSGSACCHESAR
jgi:hypothetical protein